MTNNDNSQKFQKIDGMINRMSNFHFKWYISFITVFGFSISLISLLFQIDNHIYKIFVASMISIISLVLLCICYVNSQKYLKMERGCRFNEKKMYQGDFENCFNPYKYKNFKDGLKEINKKTFIQYTAYSLIILDVIISLSCLFLIIFI